MCPRTKNHESCLPDSQADDCSCNISFPKQCFIIHVRSNSLIPSKETTPTDDDYSQGNRLELHSLTSTLPRPVKCLAPKAHRKHQTIMTGKRNITRRRAPRVTGNKTKTKTRHKKGKPRPSNTKKQEKMADNMQREVDAREIKGTIGESPLS